MPIRILLAMDDSESALRAVNLVADSFHSGSRVTLFNVGVDTAARFQRDSPAISPHFKARQDRITALEEKRQGQVAAAMARARDRLRRAGFDTERVEIRVAPQKLGVARDILAEARTGYDLVVMGRRGPASVKGFFQDSVSARVFTYAKDVAVLIAP